jgi:SHS2 domain-containing protein
VKDFVYIDSVAPSDCAYRAFGATLKQLFANAARAVTACMVELESVSLSRTVEIELEAATETDLLYNWLEEIIYLKDTENLFLVDFEIDITTAEIKKLKAKASGGNIDYNSQRINVDVKAVTMHKFSLEKNADGWEAFVVLDL